MFFNSVVDKYLKGLKCNLWIFINSPIDKFMIGVIK